MARTRRLRLGRPGTAAQLPAAPASPEGTASPCCRAARPLALAVAGLRLVLGITALAVPERAGRAWVGESARGRGPAVLLRAMGARDIALGAGALLSARQGRDLRRWVVGPWVRFRGQPGTGA